jgi:hypothetical protein
MAVRVQIFHTAAQCFVIRIFRNPHHAANTGTVIYNHPRGPSVTAYREPFQKAPTCSKTLDFRVDTIGRVMVLGRCTHNTVGRYNSTDHSTQRRQRLRKFQFRHNPISVIGTSHFLRPIGLRSVHQIRPQFYKKIVFMLRRFSHQESIGTPPYPDKPSIGVGEHDLGVDVSATFASRLRDRGADPTVSALKPAKPVPASTV